MKHTYLKHDQAGGSRRQRWVAPSAFVMTLLAMPAQAEIKIPDDPLTTAARVAPNILFILDDSGSMAWRNMNNRDVLEISGAGNFSSRPDRDGVSTGTSYHSESTSNAAMYMQGYATNSLYYNPTVDYQPWMQASGARMTGGQDFKSVYSDDLNVTYAPASTSGGSRSLASNNQTFFVPKNLANTSSAYLSNVANYYRYQILAGGSIYRSEYLAYSATNTPSGSGTRGCATTNSGYGWRNCQLATPTGRTESQEKTNFATWYSYHRTRTKAAKAGAAEAFGSLDSKVRVGFRTIWDRKNFDIPVNDGNDGRFVNNVRDASVQGSTNTTSRSTWFNRLFAASASNGTPLQAALDSAGQYFSRADAAGPYGPESGSAQLSCRQNFAILTTDGYWNTSVANSGNADGASGSVIKGPQGKTYTYSPAAPFNDSYSNTLADVAMRYWKTDLRTEDHMGNGATPENNNVPTTDANPAFWQHMVTFGISIGLKTTRGWSSVDDVPADPSWPDPGTGSPSSDKAERIDDLLHAAVNGHGQFVAASSPAEFTKGLGAALAAIAQRTGSFSNVATNSTSLNTGSRAFSASYISGVWTGSVMGQAVTRNGVSAGWTSSVPAFGSRKVFTYGSDFPTTAQASLLERAGGPADYPVTGIENANYIKGDASKEERNGGVLRNRPNTVLGDIVGSSPAYVKESDTLYVGANDGMLHAFNASNGEEVFAYVPGIVAFNKLAMLSRGDYAHKFLVDGPVVVTSRSLTPGKNILVGALGKGGKGLYALDVTSPGAASAASVSKWERAETPDNNMGLVMGRPILSLVQGASAPAAVLGNGVNSTGNKAVLLVINAETGAVIREVDTGVGSDAAPNGLSAPTGVYGPDGKTLAYAYAGDMLGNVWKFDLTSSNPASWTAKRLFTAMDGANKAQPISAGVTIAVHPRTSKRWVFFGTGRYLASEDADSTNKDVQSMYGFIDSDETIARSDLTSRIVKITTATESGFAVRAFEGKATLPADSKGWYIDLPDQGERIVQDAQVVASFLITASMVPTGSACDANGRGYINALDAFTGTSAGGSYFDLDNDQKTDDKTSGLPIGSVDAGVGMPTLPNLMRGVTLLGGSGGSIGTLRTLTPRWDRVSWRELRVD